MNFEDGTCQWDDMKDSFEISKHALQIHTPMRQNGDIDCANAEGERKYPRLDYSKGFPDWWHLDRTDVKVPSEHTQHGKRYAAEISLAHFYEIGHYKNQVGYVTIFMQDYPNQTPWNYLDKLICQWRHEEEKQRKECGMPPAPVYKMCELYRGQERTLEDLQFDDERGESSATFDQTSQMDRPNAIPIEDFGNNPDAKLLPLKLCQGNCNSTEECARGLICHRRDPNEAVPGCTGGEENGKETSFCVFDPFGEGYNLQQVNASTGNPTKTASPTMTQLDPKPVIRNSDSVPPNIDCKAYEDNGVNMNRFCDNGHQDMCCQSPRSNSNYCHENYEIFGDALKSACHHCCLEERNEAYDVGDANVEKVGLELFTNKQCAEDVDNAARICKAKSCCDPDYSDTRHCRQEMEKHKDDWQRICWYCCHPSKDYPLDTAKRVLSGTSTDDSVVAKTEAELRLWHRENPRELSSKDVVFNHTQLQRVLIVREENFVEKGLKDEDAYFQEIHGAFQRRELQTPVMENYEDVHWWPYEWLLKVGTEYYYRYEGSMTVPPCYTVNHWRVMKDPIRVAKHQITELERLLAWRINGKCKADTAGKEREGNPDAVDVNRPLQELQKGHRMVFCECQDWPSKFPQERQWCQNWKKRDPELRLYENPYNWQQNGF